MLTPTALNSVIVRCFITSCKYFFYILFSRDQYLFKNRPTDGPPNSFYRSLYPKIIEDIEVTNVCGGGFHFVIDTKKWSLPIILSYNDYIKKYTWCSKSKDTNMTFFWF